MIIKNKGVAVNLELAYKWGKDKNHHSTYNKKLIYLLYTEFMLVNQ